MVLALLLIGLGLQILTLCVVLTVSGRFQQLLDTLSAIVVDIQANQLERSTAGRELLRARLAERQAQRQAQSS